MSPIIATAGDTKTFTPAPQGMHQAVAVDVIDKGILPGFQGKPSHKIDIAWQIDSLRDDGKRFIVYKRYTLSLNEKATLRKDLESWRGRAFTRAEEMGFDVESVIGANCLINVQHNAKDDKTYANVIAVTPLMKGMRRIEPLEYVRDQDRPKDGQPQAQVDDAHDPDSHEIEEDDIPF